MAIIRERRKAAIYGLYSRAALIYLVLGAIVIATSQLPGFRFVEVGEDPTQLERFAPLMFLAVATIVIWRSYRKLSVLLMIYSLYRVVFFVLNGLGTLFALRTEAVMAEGAQWTNTQSAQAFLKSELATDTPFFEIVRLSVRQPVSIAELLPLPESVLGPLRGLVVKPAHVAFFDALLMLLVALAIWRAVRHPK